MQIETEVRYHDGVIHPVTIETKNFDCTSDFPEHALRFVIWEIDLDNGNRCTVDIYEIDEDFVRKHTGKTDRSKKPFEWGGLQFPANAVRRGLAYIARGLQ